MTIQGAIDELMNLLDADDVPIYYKPSIEKVIDTIILDMARHKADRKTEPQTDCDKCKWYDTGLCWSKIDSDDHACHYEPKDEPQADGILFKGDLKEGEYKLIKTTDGWVLANEDIVYCGWERSE